MIGIYKIENLINQKIYIGQSVNIERRWKSHKKDAFDVNNHNYNTHLYRSIRKYGLENFSFEVIEECCINELNDRERYWIKQYNSFFNGYNLTFGGDSSGSEINKDKIINIINELENTYKSHEQIAKENDITREMVQGINSGRYWRHDRNYPIQDPKAQFYRRGYSCRTDSHKQYFCVDCGKEISKGAQRCVACEALRRKNLPLSVSREELKTLIRTLSFIEIGKKYNVTDNAVRKWCKKYGLPYRVKDIKTFSDEDWINI